MRRIKRRKILKTKDLFILISILISMFSFVFLKLVDKALVPILHNYAESETITLITLLINESIKNYSNSDFINESIKTVTNSNNEIISIDFDTLSINRSLYEITENIQYNLKSIENKKSVLPTKYEIFDEEGRIIYFIPMGVLMGNSILSNIGPKIPVSASVIGDVISNLRTETSSYGINNSLIKIYVDIDVSAMMVLPFTSKRFNIKNEVLIGMKVVQGSVPEYYGSSLMTNTPLVTSK